MGERQREEKKNRHRGETEMEEMEGHLRYRELGPPNSSGFQGNGDGGALGRIPSPWNGSELIPTPFHFHFHVPVTP